MIFHRLIKPYDDAVDNRLRVICNPKEFVAKTAENLGEDELQMDPSIDKEIQTEEFQRAFVMLLIEAYTDFLLNGELEPEAVKKCKDDWYVYISLYICTTTICVYWYYAYE